MVSTPCALSPANWTVVVWKSSMSWFALWFTSWLGQVLRLLWETTSLEAHEMISTRIQCLLFPRAIYSLVIVRSTLWPRIPVSTWVTLSYAPHSMGKPVPSRGNSRTFPSGMLCIPSHHLVRASFIWKIFAISWTWTIVRWWKAIDEGDVETVIAINTLEIDQVWLSWMLLICVISWRNCGM